MLEQHVPLIRRSLYMEKEREVSGGVFEDRWWDSLAPQRPRPPLIDRSGYLVPEGVPISPPVVHGVPV